MNAKRCRNAATAFSWRQRGQRETRVATVASMRRARLSRRVRRTGWLRIRWRSQPSEGCSLSQIPLAQLITVRSVHSEKAARSRDEILISWFTREVGSALAVASVTHATGPRQAVDAMDTEGAA